jgi:regulatory protein
MLGKPKRLGKQDLLAYSLKLLSARALSEAEVRTRLRRRAAVEADADEVIVRLKELRLLNDQRFAEGFAAARLSSQGFGKLRVMSDLAGRRVPRDVARKAVEGAFQHTDEKALIEQYLERKYRGRNLPALLQEEKHLASAYRRLRAAGFSSRASVDVLKKFSRQAELFEDASEEPDECNSPQAES